MKIPKHPSMIPIASPFNINPKLNIELSRYTK